MPAPPPPTSTRTDSATVAQVALIGLLGLAAAMGVGRFAFTPLLPLMQASGALSLSDGGWLASANYLGYLLGGLSGLFWTPRPGQAARWALVLVALTTVLMGVTSQFVLWWTLRLVAGIASAWVLIGTSGWALPRLAAAGRPQASGWVFAGVGSGIVLAGLLTLWIGSSGRGAAQGWLWLGALAAVAPLAGWRLFGQRSHDAMAGPATAAASTTAASTTAALPPAAPVPAPPVARQLTLIACYGVFGFGYIIPATFLPALARQQISDPSVFGWTWPVFGLAAAVSTVLGASLMARSSARRVWAMAQWLMAIGVLLPLLDSGLAMLIASALCVGGTFMLATMAGMVEARRVGGANAARLTAAMTSAFAFGQLLGPLAVSASAGQADPFRWPGAIAVALLLASGWALFRNTAR